MTACEPLELEILPPYIGSAVSPEVDITETTNDVTVTITDFRGEHAYTVDKTDQAIADAEQAATNANTAAGGANQAAQAATQAAGTANTSAQNADTKAALADSKAALANQAATTANQAAQAAEAAKTAANTAAGQATTAAGNATTAATNADAKAALANTAATNADTATAAANTATTNATNAAQAANNAADVAIEAAEDMPRLIATVDTAQTVADAWETTMEGATVYGKSVQDGTPTPDDHVPVQVVGGRNLFNSNSTYTKTFAGSSGDEYTTVNNVISGVNAVMTAHMGEVLTFSADVVADVPKELYLYANKPSVIRQTFTLGSTPTRINITLTSETNLTFTLGSRDGVAATVTLSNVQIEAGTHATPYTPYGCIGLQTGETVTPIDLHGHGIPEGDLLRVDSTGHVTIEQGETPTIIDLGTIELQELTNPCTLAFYASLDPEWAIQYEQDPNAVITSLQSSIAPVEGSTASTNYAVNSYLIQANQLYRVTSAIATGEAITPGSNCVACTVMGEVIRLTN